MLKVGHDDRHAPFHHRQDEIVLAGDLRRIEVDVIAAPRARMHAPTAHAPQDLLIVDFDFDHEIDIDSCLTQRFGLRDVARKAVDDEAFRGIGLLDTFLDELDDERIRNELTDEHLNPILLEAHQETHEATRALGVSTYRELYDRFDYRLDGPVDSWQELCPACKRRGIGRAQLRQKEAARG